MNSHVTKAFKYKSLIQDAENIIKTLDGQIDEYFDFEHFIQKRAILFVVNRQRCIAELDDSVADST